MKLKLILFFLAALVACSSEKEAEIVEKPTSRNKGSLFIIGGGNRGAAMIDRLIDEAGVRNEGYVYILPMASSLADSAIIWSSEQFWDAGLSNVFGFNFHSREVMTPSRMDSVSNAPLIFISGGDQRRFMELVNGSPLEKALKKAHENGAVIAGTSAGAAVMSKLMVTGTELRHPDYYSTFRHLEKNNIELDTGMAFLDQVIIDQHFVRRSRYNRLISAMAEYPAYLGIGIDESTAILVKGDSAEVVGVP